MSQQRPQSFPLRAGNLPSQGLEGLDAGRSIPVNQGVGRRFLSNLVAHARRIGLFILLTSSIIIPSIIFTCIVGSIPVLAGNGILRATHPGGHYTNNLSAFLIGIVGSSSLFPILFVVALLLKNNIIVENGMLLMLVLQSIAFILASTLIGALGGYLLDTPPAFLGPINILHATGAGAIGGAILSLPLVIATHLVSFAAGKVLYPILNKLEAEFPRFGWALSPDIGDD